MHMFMVFCALKTKLALIVVYYLSYDAMSVLVPFIQIPFATELVTVILSIYFFRRLRQNEVRLFKTALCVV